MAYAIDAMKTSFEETKSIFFPINKMYWIKMGILSMFARKSSHGTRSFDGIGDLSNLARNPTSLSFSQFILQYGLFIGLGVFIFALIGFLFTYLNSVLTFVFLQSLVEKKCEIRKSFSQNNAKGLSFFYFRLLLGVFLVLLFMFIAAPFVYTHMYSSFDNVNIAVFIISGILVFLFILCISIIKFLAYDFIVPSMFLHNENFNSSFKRFKQYFKSNILDIIVYGLLKLVLTLGVGIAVILALIPIVGIIVLLVLLGGMIFATMGIDYSQPLFWYISLPIAFVFLIIFSIVVHILFVPLPSFFALYSLHMVKLLEKQDTKKTKTF